MADAMEHIDYLANEIGPRPAGTEEEQQAALYITEHMRKEAGLSTTIEDFNGIADEKTSKVIYACVVIVITILAIILPVLSFPALVVDIVATIFLFLELTGRSILSRLFKQGISQNVVAKYEPPENESNGTRPKRIVVVAHYDSGKVRKELGGKIVGRMPLVLTLSRYAFIATSVLMLIRCLFFAQASGIPVVFINVLTFLALILVAVPVALFVLEKTSSYNDAANANASGVAALLDIATIVAKGQNEGMGEYDDEERSASERRRVHGEEAALSSGFVPDEAELVYASKKGAYEEDIPDTPEARLASAKAAIFALTGKPVSSTMQRSCSAETAASHQAQDGQDESGFQPYAQEKPAGERTEPQQASQQQLNDYQPGPGAGEQMNQAADRTEGQSAQVPVSFAPMPQPVQQSAPVDEVPDWFKSAREKARKTPEDSKVVHRSQYADAFDTINENQAASGSSNWENMWTTAAVEQQKRIEREEMIAQQQARLAASVAARQAQEAAAAEQPRGSFVDDGRMIVGVDDRSEDGGTRVLPESVDLDQLVAEIAPAMEERVLVENDELAQTLVEGSGEDGVESGLVEQSTIAMQPIADELEVEPAADAEVVDEAEPVAEEKAEEPTVEEPSVPAHEEELILEASEREDLRKFADRDAEAIRRRAVRRQKKREAKGLEESVEQERPQEESIRRRRSNEPDATIEYIPEELTERPEIGPVTLPELSVGDKETPIIEKKTKQRAPLAEASESGVQAAQSLLSLLPSVGSADEESVLAEKAGRKGSRRENDLQGLSLPSLSGEIRNLRRGEKGDHDDSDGFGEGLSNTTGSFAPVSMTGAFAPVGEELMQKAEEDETIFVDDADDSVFEGNVTETGAFAGPDYVDMPKGRGLFGKGRRRKKAKKGGKQKKEEKSMREWLEVDDDFDARAVGKARGGWESFREDDEIIDEAFDDEFDDGFDDRDSDWNGGAFSPSDKSSDDDALERYDAYDGALADGRDEGYGLEDDEYFDEEDIAYDDDEAFEEYEDFEEFEGDEYEYDDEVGRQYDDEYEEDFEDEGEEESKRKFKKGRGGAKKSLSSLISKVKRGDKGDVKESPRAKSGKRAEKRSRRTKRSSYERDESRASRRDVERIYEFQNGWINAEVWFVALGAELSGNSGMKAFLAEHSQEIKGSIILDLDSLGAGELSYIDLEGAFRPSKISARLSKTARRASQSSGIDISSAQLLIEESTASFANKNGYHAIHLCGMDGAKQAFYGEKDDTIDVIDESILQQNIAYVLDFIHAI